MNTMNTIVLHEDHEEFMLPLFHKTYQNKSTESWKGNSSVRNIATERVLCLLILLDGKCFCDLDHFYILFLF